MDVETQKFEEFPMKVMEFLKSFILEYKTCLNTNIYYRALKTAYKLCVFGNLNHFNELTLDKIEYSNRETDFKMFVIEGNLRSTYYALDVVLSFKNFTFAFENQKVFIKRIKHINFTQSKTNFLNFNRISKHVIEDKQITKRLGKGTFVKQH